MRSPHSNILLYIVKAALEQHHCSTCCSTANGTVIRKLHTFSDSLLNHDHAGPAILSVNAHSGNAPPTKTPETGLSTCSTIVCCARISVVCIKTHPILADYISNMHHPKTTDLQTSEDVTYILFPRQRWTHRPHTCRATTASYPPCPSVIHNRTTMCFHGSFPHPRQILDMLQQAFSHHAFSPNRMLHIIHFIPVLWALRSLLDA